MSNGQNGDKNDIPQQRLMEGSTLWGTDFEVVFFFFLRTIYHLSHTVRVGGVVVFVTSAVGLVRSRKQSQSQLPVCQSVPM